MAKNKSTVYLGFDDEEIIAKHVQYLNSNVNKIGGNPDWPSSDIKVPACPLCGTARPLIVQLYAPLEHSQFHRSLYVFGCLNPACSQSSKSWLCIRTQYLDILSPTEIINAMQVPPLSGAGAQKQKKKKSQKITWCNGADDWGAVAEASSCEKMDTAADDEEENGNVIAKHDNSALCFRAADSDGIGSPSEPDNDYAEEEDDEDESSSMENDLICGFGQIDMNLHQNVGEDPNANCAAGIDAVAVRDGNIDIDLGGGGGVVATATICAELEDAENDVVHVETPKKPERDLIALLKHTSTPAALGPLVKITDVTLKSYFIAVDIELRQQHQNAEYANCDGALSDDHIRELYQDYKRQDEAAHSPSNGSASGSSGATVVAAGDEQESYENSVPAHGDVIFHQFITTIQQNPGQILRYSRDTLPLLIAPLTEPIPKCQNCNGETICEIQILSTLIPKLRLQQNNEAAPIEYGNVLVFTCLKSCWDTPDKMRYERVLVQAEL